MSQWHVASLLQQSSNHAQHVCDRSHKYTNTGVALPSGLLNWIHQTRRVCVFINQHDLSTSCFCTKLHDRANDVCVSIGTILKQVSISSGLQFCASFPQVIRSTGQPQSHFVLLLHWKTFNSVELNRNALHINAMCMKTTLLCFKILDQPRQHDVAQHCTSTGANANSHIDMWLKCDWFPWSTNATCVIFVRL